jgi:RsiW-degrading membrane proteinase PrsW (M82 family)
MNFYIENFLSPFERMMWNTNSFVFLISFIILFSFIGLMYYYIKDRNKK